MNTLAITYNEDCLHPIVTNRTDDREEYEYLMEYRDQSDKYCYNLNNANHVKMKLAFENKNHLHLLLILMTVLYFDEMGALLRCDRITLTLQPFIKQELSNKEVFGSSSSKGV